MNNLITNHLNLFRNNYFKNVLIYNYESVTVNELLEISQYCDNVYVLCYGNFLISSLSIKLRLHKKIKVMSLNYIPMIQYDVIFAPYLKNIFDLLINNPEIKFFINLDGNNNIDIQGFEKIGNDIYLRHKNKVLIDINESFNEFNETKKRLNNILIPAENRSKNVEIKKQNFYEINIKNIIPTRVQYNTMFKRKNIDGIIGIKFIVNNENDVKIYNKNIKKLIEKYQYIKTYIVFNGKNTFKYVSDIKNCNNCFKFEEKQSDEMLNVMLDNFCNHEYSFDLVNNEIDNEWKFLK